MDTTVQRNNDNILAMDLDNSINTDEVPFIKSKKILRSPTILIPREKGCIEPTVNSVEDGTKTTLGVVQCPKVLVNELRKEDLITDTERHLYDLLISEREVMKTLMDSIKKLEARVEQIDTTRKNNTPTHSQEVSFKTDEEVLERETDWILKKRPTKKRKAVSSPVSESH